MCTSHLQTSCLVHAFPLCGLSPSLCFTSVPLPSTSIQWQRVSLEWIVTSGRNCRFPTLHLNKHCVELIFESSPVLRVYDNSLLGTGEWTPFPLQIPLCWARWQVDHRYWTLSVQLSLSHPPPAQTVLRNKMQGVCFSALVVLICSLWFHLCTWIQERNCCFVRHGG